MDGNSTVKLKFLEKSFFPQPLEAYLDDITNSQSFASLDLGKIAIEEVVKAILKSI